MLIETKDGYGKRVVAVVILQHDISGVGVLGIGHCALDPCPVQQAKLMDWQYICCVGDWAVIHVGTCRLLTLVIE